VLSERAESLERTAIDAAPDGVLMVDARGIILKANPAMEVLSGYSRAEMEGQSVNMFMPERMRGKHADLIAGYFVQPVARPMGLVRQLQLLRNDGTMVPVDIALGHCSVAGEPAAVVFIRDMTEVRRLQDDMQYQATHDSLTGLANRWMFGQHFEQAILRASRSGHPLALLLLDLDDFKGINDAHGHPVGDQVLMEVARRLRGALRAGDVLSRLGGDEFTVLLPELPSLGHAQQVAEKLQRLLSAPCRLQGCEVRLGASIGLACYPADARDAETLMRYADLAMYAAKGRGRGVWAAYEPQMSQALAEKNQLHDRLKLAMERGGLALHYQPQVAVAGGGIVGVEALLRWHDPELGPISPERFIPVAVCSGLIQSLGDWVLDSACRQSALWAQAGTPVRISVNLSAQQFRQTELVDRLAQLMALHGTLPEMLELEITETEAMADPEMAREVLLRLRALGVSIALDDFGTGYSSLSYLRLLPVSRLKIDREFTRHIMSRPDDATLVRAVIALAHTLGLPVVAEGVETEGQLRFLRQHHCEVFQGWLYAPALPADEVGAMLRAELDTGESDELASRYA
jgi:diguanylate cyclase (GGDEF)-like protein/PAS domain S-box-containing protein